MYFEEAPGTRDPAGLWREINPRQKRLIQRGLVVVLALVAASHFLWFIPMDAPDWVWDRAEKMDLPDWLDVESAVSYASPLQWRVVYSGRMSSGAHAEAVYTYYGLRGTEELVVSGGPVGGARVRLYFGALLLLLAVTAIWSTMRKPSQ
ncbi:MAG: hypothetical protein R6U70_02495 [Bacillota bacterium]